MSEIEKKDNRVKLYGVIIGLVTLALQHGFYLLGHLIASLAGFEPFLPKIPLIDDAIMIVPIFIIPYIWSYAYWAMAPMAVSKCKFDHFLDYLASYLIACVIGCLILSFAPSYMDRVAEGLYDVNNKGFFYDLTRFWYSLDGTKVAYNLFPSFHCLNSTISFLGVFRRKEIPLWYRIYSFVLTLTIYASTVFVKQHYFIDIIGGVLIGVIAYIVSERWHLGRMFLKPIARVKGWFHKEKAA